jgi:phage terminase large subunit-like protein
MVLAENGDGSWAAPEAGWLVARQNGKGGSLEAIVLHGMFLVGDPLTLWTAHQTKTAFEAFLRIQGLIEGSSDLSRKVRSVSRANGEEGVQLTSGPRLRFVARSKSSGRGFSPQRIVFDEAQELATAAVSAMLFSVSAQQNPQLLFTGTVPNAENNAEHWTSVRDRGRKAESSRLAWAEWNPEGSDDPVTAAGLDLDDRKHWRWANPAAGYRLTEATIGAEREALASAPEVFAAERLSVWPSLDEYGSGVIDPAAWAGCGTEERVAVSGVVLAVETTTDRSSSAIVAVGTRPDGLPQVEIVDVAAGTQWVVERVVQTVQNNSDIVGVVVDARSSTSSLIPALQSALESLDVELTVTSTSDMAQACGQFFDAVVQGSLRHLEDPRLTASVRSAVQRPLGDAWAWSRRLGGPAISPLVGGTLGLWLWNQLTGSDYDVMDSFF